MNRYDLKYNLVRFFLKAITFFFPLRPLDLNTDKFIIQPRLEGFLKEKVAEAFIKVFSERPWNENWLKEEVLAKMDRELTENSFIVVLRGNENFPVAGFCWGRILKVDELETHIEPALGVKPIGLENSIRKLAGKDERILYFHEFAILRQFRRGIEPLRFLLLPSLQFGWLQGVNKTLFWTSPESKIFPLSLYMGYRPILETKAKEKKIYFMYNPDFRSLLNIAQRIKERRVAKIMRFTSVFY